MSTEGNLEKPLAVSFLELVARIKGYAEGATAKGASKLTKHDGYYRILSDIERTLSETVFQGIEERSA